MLEGPWESIKALFAEQSELHFPINEGVTKESAVQLLFSFHIIHFLESVWKVEREENGKGPAFLMVLFDAVRC